MGGLGTFLVALAGPLAKRVLAALGMGVVSFAAVSTALNYALDAAKNAWSGVGGEALAIMQIAGVNTVASIFAGALTARVSLMVLKRLQILA